MRVKKISVRWLRRHGACPLGIAKFKIQKETDPIKVLEKLIKTGGFDWAYWLLENIMSKKEGEVWRDADNGRSFPTHLKFLRYGLKILKGKSNDNKEQRRQTSKWKHIGYGICYKCGTVGQFVKDSKLCESCYQKEMPTQFRDRLNPSSPRDVSKPQRIKQMTFRQKLREVLWDAQDEIPAHYYNWCDLWCDLKGGDRVKNRRKRKLTGWRLRRIKLMLLSGVLSGAGKSEK